MSHLFNLPDNVYDNYDFYEISKIKKLYLFFHSRFFILIYKLFKNNIYAKVINLFFVKKGKVTYLKNLGYNYHYQNISLVYPNKLRIFRAIDKVDNLKIRFEEKYFLKKINFKRDDLIVDCGANIGELYFSVPDTKDFEYIAFEPDINNFKCLSKNLSDFKNVKLYETGLSNNSSEEKFYISSDGSDSSFSYYGEEKHLVVKTKPLDYFKITKVKLLKIEAEGFEPEILIGAKNTIKNTEFISVDVSCERGQYSQSTLPEVTNYLIQNNFQLIAFNPKYFSVLFKNKDS
tara:strand:+ start:251 stop:1117 length:867 start_codon:yes stop_codon:yes gene_type:complete